MKYEPIIPDRVERDALRRTATKSLGRALTGLVGVSLTAGAVVGTVVPALLGLSGTMALSVGMVTALAVGGLVAAALGQPIVRVIAEMVARPVELLLDQINEDGTGEFRWASGRALGRSEIAADLRTLEQHAREGREWTRAVVERLDEAREEANRQDLAKSQFLAAMSHELRTPLNAILGYATLLHEDAVAAGNESAATDLQRIEFAGRNLLAIINDVLDVTRLDTGRVPVKRAVLDVRALASAAAAECGAASPPNGNSFRLEIADEVDLIVGDREKIAQCLTNLISNAFKFTENGAVDLEIAPIDRDGARWLGFSVRDTGMGIAPADLSRLFETFQQLDGSPTRQFGGTGLGLAIVRRLARLMGGDCLVDSTPGRGSVFSLILPLDGPSAVPSQIDETQTFVAGSAGLRVLVIDDDAFTRDLMQRWLTKTGHQVICAPDGEEGLTLARALSPDLILLDVLLPGRSGYELLEEIGRDEQLRDVPVVLVTIDDDRPRGVQAGAADYLRKPLSEESLRAMLTLYGERVAGDVLVIDGDHRSAERVRRSVAQIGMESRHAPDGEQGMTMAGQKRPDAIILDIADAPVNGLATIERLRSDPALCTVPLVMLSGSKPSIGEHRRLAGDGRRLLPKAASTPRDIAQSIKELVACA